MNWLLLRGLVREQRHWGDFPAAFESSSSDRKVFCLDLPGFGTESSRNSPSRVSEIVDDIRARWLKLRESSSGDWSILAASLGGMIAMDWCARYPGDFQQLVVLNSSVNTFSPIYRRFRISNWPTVMRLTLSNSAEVRETGILKITITNKEIFEQSLNRNVRIATENPVRRAEMFRQLLAGARFTLNKIPEIRTLVLASDGDILCDSSCSRAIASHFKAQLRVHPTAGHDLSIDAPEWVSQEVNSWQSAALT